MRDELDRDLLRRFAQASEPLPDTQFHANVMREISRMSSPWRDLPQFIASSVGAAGSGFAIGLRALARLRLGVAGIVALLLGALALLNA